MPDAARISDHHVCPKIEPGPVPHVGGPIFSGSANVIIGQLPAARVKDRALCVPVGPTDQIRRGSTTVLINQRAAARRADPMNHGGIIVQGCPTVIIGDDSQSFVLRAAATNGTPFCEECERARQAAHDAESDAPADADPEGSVTLASDAPPGARSTFAELRALASQPDLGDGLDPQRLVARATVAWNFYLDHKDPKQTLADLESHIRAVDLHDPVQIVEIPPVGGGTLYRHTVPTHWPGQYFALDTTTTPDELGISADGYPFDANGERVMPARKRVVEPTHFSKEAPAIGLQSTSAKIVDTWSKPGTKTTTAVPVPCNGGGTQIMIPKQFHARAVTP